MRTIHPRNVALVLHRWETAAANVLRKVLNSLISFNTKPFFGRIKWGLALIQVKKSRLTIEGKSLYHYSK